ncbi:MAG: hypothetical protein L0229_06290 [Blastocatellia bacterium]|nr:hypothetical protein [Blastocatellia bacterium]
MRLDNDPALLHGTREAIINACLFLILEESFQASVITRGKDEKLTTNRNVE